MGVDHSSSGESVSLATSREQDQALAEFEIRGSLSASPEAVAITSGSALTEALDSIDCSSVVVLTVLTDAESDDALAALNHSLDSFPALRTLNLRWTSPAAGEAPQALLDLHLSCGDRNVTFHADFLLDPTADGFDVLAGKSTPLAQVLDFSNSLRGHGIDVRWLLPTHESSVFRIEGIYLLARDNGVEPLVIPIEFAVAGAEPPELSADQKQFLWDFINYRLLDADAELLRPGQVSYYIGLRDYYAGNLPETEPASVSVLTCSGVSEEWELNTRSLRGAQLRATAVNCTSIGLGPATPMRRLLGRLREAAGVLMEGGRAHVLRTLVGRRSVASVERGQKFEKVMLIGAYGGEHIGDVAILGGVLCRIQERFGTKQAVLMTQRPSHTRHLMPMMDVPVTLTVDLYDWPQIKRHVAEVDCVVFAGGPLIDLPKQLVRHLYAVSLARKQGKPFIAEGIGPGPFARLPSKWTARRLIELADRISVRSSDGPSYEVLRGLEVEAGRCPAFDYLATRGDRLSRLPASEEVAIETLLEGTQERPIVGLNIRPVGHLYTAGAGDEDPAVYTRRIEERFEHRLADGMREFHQQAGPDKKPCYVFFPMNSIQFGMSDILSAYRLQRILGSDVDFRVWESDASLDGVLSLMRRLDVAITMRFHAAIFALSQNRKVIGVDYRIGMRDKVAELMDDVDQGENCARIDLLTGDWLAQSLAELTIE